MGLIKRLMEEREGKESVAKKIALEAGVLGRCPFHENYVFDTGEDITNAYRLANWKFTRNEVIFEDRLEMTDMIKEVVQNHPYESESGCHYCEKW